MKPLCPRCQSSAVYVMTDGTNQQLVDEPLSPTALIGLGVSLCKSFKVHPVIGVITATAIASAVSVATRRAQTPLITTPQQNYLCQRCFKPFTL